jgi:pimeloyl-ACP methyl ester carboxylesterase
MIDLEHDRPPRSDERSAMTPPTDPTTGDAGSATSTSADGDARPGDRPAIVLIHGLWMTPKSWAGWTSRFERAGYEVLVPGWPGVTEDVEGLRADPSGLNGLRIRTVVDHYAAIIEALPRPPIIMGHSFGGLMVQLLLDRGLGRVGIAIDAAQTAGVPVLPWTVVRAAMPVLGKPWTVGRTVLLTPKQFHYAFTNTLSLEETRAVSDELQIPAPGKPLWQAATHLLMNRGDSAVDYAREGRAPLLFVAGGADHIVPPKVNRKNAARYRSGTVEVQEFAGRTHFTVGQDGWEEVADAALAWAEAHG